MNFAQFMRGTKPREYNGDYPEYKGSFLRRKHIKDILDGDYYRLDTAFLWSATPQGRSHWEGKEELTEEDIDYLHFLLKKRGGTQ